MLFRFSALTKRTENASGSLTRNMTLCRIFPQARSSRTQFPITRATSGSSPVRARSASLTRTQKKSALQSLKTRKFKTALPLPRTECTSFPTRPCTALTLTKPKRLTTPGAPSMTAEQRSSPAQSIRAAEPLRLCLTCPAQTAP